MAAILKTHIYGSPYDSDKYLQIFLRLQTQMNANRPHWWLLLISQLWHPGQQWFDAIGQQGITWANVDQVLWCYLASTWMHQRCTPLAITPSHHQNTHVFAHGRKNMNDIFNNYVCSASHMRPELHFQNVWHEPWCNFYCVHFDSMNIQYFCNHNTNKMPRRFCLSGSHQQCSLSLVVNSTLEPLLYHPDQIGTK